MSPIGMPSNDILADVGCLITWLILGLSQTKQKSIEKP